MKKKARVIAFYLPQFHPTAENDKFWGKGFTEWTNVTKAQPLFRGHYQPKLPADLGFYDLRLPIIREQQAELARQAGIEGFMYWHYWFGNGKMTLEKPFEEVLSSGKPDFPFCLGWANHTWSNKTWTKGKAFQKDTIIFEQTYPGKEDWLKHFNYCLSAFKDSRYIKIDGKPLFFIWAPSHVPQIKEFIKYWRELAVLAGLEGIHFVGMKWSDFPVERYYDMGFDAINNVNIDVAENNAMNKILKKMRGALIKYSDGTIHLLRKFDYAKIIKYLPSPIDREENVYPTIVSGYDRTARAGRKATIYYNYTPENFSRHVEDIIKSVQGKSEEHKIIFLKSWNEWAEGNYVEPDLKYGHAFLNVLKKHLKE